MRSCWLVVYLFISVSAYSQIWFSKSDAVADIDFYNTTLEQVHYNPFLYISKHDYYKLSDSIKNTIGDSIELKSFILKLYSLTALLQDGYANPTVPLLLRPELIKKQFLPLALVADEQQRIFVKDAVDNHIPKGSQVLSVNGIDMKGFIEKASRYPGGLPHFRKEMACIFFSYYLFLNNVSTPFTISYLDPNRQLQKVVIAEGIDFQTSFSLSVPASGKPRYSFKIINGKVGYIDFVSMTGDYRKFDQFLDSSFTVMRNNNINTLAVDLRKNSGGNSLLGELLLSYITKKDFSLMGGRYWKISQQYKDYLRSKGDSTSDYLKQKNGVTWHIGECGPKKQKFRVDTVFTGKVYMMTGAFTYSSANMLADGAKQYKLTTVIGEPTGESTNDFGEVYLAELPATKVKVQLTTAFDIGADCKKDHDRPVIPDTIIRTSVHDKINNIDPVMDYILKNN